MADTVATMTHVLPLQQGLGGRQAHLLDVLVDAGILLDEQVAGRHVGLRLVVVVIRDEVLHRVLREELAELGVQLRRQGLVGRHAPGRPAQAGDDVGHGVGLARAGHAQQGLERRPSVHAAHQLLDRLGLVAGGRKRLMQS
jgi:hypothetical protein